MSSFLAVHAQFPAGSIAYVPDARGPMVPTTAGVFGRQRLLTDPLFYADITLDNIVSGSRYRITRKDTGAELATGVASATAVVARPSSDIALPGNFAASTGGVLYSMIDEVTASDADYIYNVTNGFVWTQIGLGAVANPGVNTGHVVNIRAWKTGAPVSYLFCYLHQGATVIKTNIIELTSTTPQTFSYALTEAEAALITDYSALEIRLIVTSGVANMSWFELQVPDEVSKISKTISGIPVFANPMMTDITVRKASSSPNYKVFDTAASVGRDGVTAYILQQLDE